VLDALTSLVAKSLLNSDRGHPGPTRYQMLESLRHYARERLDAGGVADETRRRHARYYATGAAEINSGLRGPDEVLWLPRFDAELENFRAAISWALDSALEDDQMLAMTMLGELVSPSVVSNNIFGGVDDQVTDQVVELARRSASPYAGLVLAAACINAWYRGNFSHGRELAREAMQGVRTSPHPGGLLTLSLMFADPPSLAGELAGALHVLDEVGADRRDYALVRGAATGQAALFGNLTLARQEAPIALEVARGIGNPTQLGLALHGFGLAFCESDPAAAQAALEEAIQTAPYTNRSTFARVRALLAVLQARGGDPGASVGTLREALESAHINGDRPGLADCLLRGCGVMAALGEYETAAVLWGAVTEGIFGRLIFPPIEISAHNEFMATVRSLLGDDSYIAATARGAAMTYEQITTFALAVVERL
jgi:hypothetical protein